MNTDGFFGRCQMYAALVNSPFTPVLLFKSKIMTILIKKERKTFLSLDLCLSGEVRTGALLKMTSHL